MGSPRNIARQPEGGQRHEVYSRVRPIGKLLISPAGRALTRVSGRNRLGRLRDPIGEYDAPLLAVLTIYDNPARMPSSSW